MTRTRINDDILNRLKGTFLEVPGTTLTVDEAARLCGLGVPESGALLDRLKESGFLIARPDGSFVRAG
ncbi:MAG: hypothetical protein IT176_12055 [Acidobacteria bacterium]|nr:hypothetical protein [Acidobacteriota bacterium]